VRRAKFKWLGVAAIAVTLLAFTHRRHSGFRLVYNPSASAPQGWYTVSATRDLKVDDYVLANLPPTPKRLADQRGYLPKAVPLLKRIAAVADQFVCVRGRSLWVDGGLVATALVRDSRGRELLVWKGCRVLESDELLLISRENSASFDSRYFGPIRISRVIGKAVPFWIR
jgi:conjugative transfer signal peptidase TraF